ncbi:FAD-binding oxidoreductase [Paraconexibacter sp.]|uniref:FAD-binding oxidoreductase n=1 Tax=Paraconexibacter sp. TaxID=2949640 RepID=UPI0035627C38
MSLSSVLEPRSTARVLPDAILPHHAAYDEARTAWNLTADQRPAAVVVAHDAAEVLSALDLARAFDLRVVPQGTGHLASALPDMSDAILLRTDIGGVTVDPDARIARVGAGAVWQDVVDAVTPYGLAALSGSSHDVGVTGYALGGGLSWLARSKGLLANNIRSIELATAGGRLLRVDAQHHAELFWALRGGGGNFGVVTAIEIDLFPITEVFAGMTVWPADQAREVLAAWVAWSRTAPEAVTTSWRLLRLPDLPEIPDPLRDTPLVVIDGAVLADGPAAAGMLGAFRGVGTPVMDTWDTMSPAGLLQLHMDPPEPVPGLGDTALIESLDEAGIDVLLDAARPQEISPLLFIELRQLGGAVGREAPGAGARAKLDGEFALFVIGMPMSPEHGRAIDERLVEIVAAMRPWSTGGVYANFAERGGSMASAFDARTFARLQEARAVWDPSEMFVASHRIDVP